MNNENTNIVHVQNQTMSMN